LDKVNFLTGMVFSNIMLASVPVAFENKIIYVSPECRALAFRRQAVQPVPLRGLLAERRLPRGRGPARHQPRLQERIPHRAELPGRERTRSTGFKRFYKGNVAAEVYTQLGQLDYSAELAQVRAAKPDALYIFLPGGMGINFIKQFVAAGLSKDVPLIVPGFGSDQDIIRPVGDAMLGLFDTAHWAPDFDNAANRKFVAAFEKEYKRIPSVFAAQGYDAALLIDAAVRDVKGKVEDVEAVRKAMKAGTLRVGARRVQGSTGTRCRSRTTICAWWRGTTRGASSTRPSAPSSRTTATRTSRIVR
jgi:branched-chain amino acid transport system substrate-binding protein